LPRLLFKERLEPSGGQGPLAFRQVTPVQVFSRATISARDGSRRLIIFAHFSTRYHPQEIRRLLEGKLPPHLQERLKLWI
jgi:hypothetical protein